MNLQPIQKTPAAARFLCATCNQWRAVFADLDGEPFKAYYCDQCAAELTAKQEPRTMLNTPEAYRQAGHATATARRQGDEARAAHHKQWFTRAQALEQPEHRTEARRLFDEGYADAQPHRPAHYFN